MSTVFTKIINGEIPCYKIAEDENAIAFLDINPISVGHTLVVPKKEVDYIFSMDDEDLKNLIIFAKKVAQAIKKTVTCERIGMAVIGIEVPHTHIHLSPINQVGDLSFTGERVKLTKEQFARLSDEISKNIDI